MSKDRAADGIRGIAALCVVLCHFLISVSPIGFASIYPNESLPGAPHHFLDKIISLPIVSMLWNGNFAVCIFFVLSGYVLTKAFVDTGDMQSMQLRAARRYLRLSVPIMGSVLLAYVAMRLGLRRNQEAGQLSGSLWLQHFWDFEPSLIEALKQGTYGAIFFGKSSVVPILWTMRIEFIGSMIVFATRALMPKGNSAWVAMACLLAALIAFFPHEWMFYSGFIAGSYLGQLKQGHFRFPPWLAVAVAAYFGSYQQTNWYGWVSTLSIDAAAQKNLMQVIGAIALLYAVRAGLGKSFLEASVPQFLARISYATYLVHFPILLTLTSWVFVTLRPSMAFGFAAAIDLIITIAAVISIADVFERIFDRAGILLSQAVFPSREAHRH